MTAQALQAFTAGLTPEFSQTVIQLDETIHRAATLDSAIKWRQLTYAVDADYHMDLRHQCDQKARHPALPFWRDARRPGGRVARRGEQVGAEHGF